MVRNDRREVLSTFGAAGLIGVAGCISGFTGESDSDDDNSADTVAWWNLYVQGTQKDTADEIAAQFEEETGIEVEQTRYENTPYKEAITNALGTNNAPDVFYVWPGPNRLGRYVQNESVTSLDDHFSDEELEPYLDAAITGVQYEPGEILSWQNEDGQMFAFPQDIAGIPLYYNKNVLEDAGVDPDRLQHATDTTWNEFLEICEAVADAGYTPIQCGNRNQWTIGHYISAFMIKAVGTQDYISTAYGTNDMSFTDEAFVTALSRLQELYDREYINNDINSLNNNEAASLFFNDEAAFWSMTTGVDELISSQAPDDFDGIPEAMDYTWWPYFPDLYENGANERVALTNATFAVSAQAAERGEENLENTIEFLKYLNSLENHQYWYETAGGLVTHLDVYDDEDTEMGPLQETLSVALTQVQEADQMGPVFDVAFLPEPTETLLAGGQELFTGTSPEDILEDLQETTERTLSGL